MSLASRPRVEPYHGSALGGENIPPLKRHYCVLTVEHGDICYQGGSERACAVALEPGTCYGIGKDEQAAWRRAVGVRAGMLA